MKHYEKITMPFGMIGSIIYLIHTILGRILWTEYNPVTTDISSLTAVGAPNRDLLLVFTTIYGISMIVFSIGMIQKSLREYNRIICTGWILLFIMNVISFLGYLLFPLTNDKTEMTFGNMMHIVVTMLVVFTTIAGGFTLAIGYIRQAKMKKLGYFALTMAVIITVSGVLNPVGMANNWNILGVTERIVIYSLLLMNFVFSFYYTFSRQDETITLTGKKGFKL